MLELAEALLVKRGERSIARERVMHCGAERMHLVGWLNQRDLRTGISLGYGLGCTGSLRLSGTMLERYWFIPTDQRGFRRGSTWNHWKRYDYD